MWLGKGKNLHNPFPDPAKVTGSEAEKMAAFREVRDEIIAADTWTTCSTNIILGGYIGYSAFRTIKRRSIHFNHFNPRSGV